MALNKFDNAATGSLIEKRRVKYSTLTKLTFLTPNSIEEKIMIGNCFRSLDGLITLHQRLGKNMTM
jgi:type I restriction enzyme S subunit